MRLRIGGPRTVTAGWFAFAGLVLAAHVALLAFVVRPGPEVRVLHYTTAFGIDLLGAGTRLWLLPAFGGAVLVVNGAVSATLRRSSIVLRLVPVGTVVVEAALVVATLAVVRHPGP